MQRRPQFEVAPLAGLSTLQFAGAVVDGLRDPELTRSDRDRMRLAIVDGVSRKREAPLLQAPLKRCLAIATALAHVGVLMTVHFVADGDCVARNRGRELAHRRAKRMSGHAADELRIEMVALARFLLVRSGATVLPALQESWRLLASATVGLTPARCGCGVCVYDGWTYRPPPPCCCLVLRSCLVPCFCQSWAPTAVSPATPSPVMSFGPPVLTAMDS